MDIRLSIPFQRPENQTVEETVDLVKKEKIYLHLPAWKKVAVYAAKHFIFLTVFTPAVGLFWIERVFFLHSLSKVQKLNQKIKNFLDKLDHFFSRYDEKLAKEKIYAYIHQLIGVRKVKKEDVDAFLKEISFLEKLDLSHHQLGFENLSELKKNHPEYEDLLKKSFANQFLNQLLENQLPFSYEDFLSCLVLKNEETNVNVLHSIFWASEEKVLNHSSQLERAKAFSDLDEKFKIKVKNQEFANTLEGKQKYITSLSWKMKGWREDLFSLSFYPFEKIISEAVKTGHCKKILLPNFGKQVPKEVLDLLKEKRFVQKNLNVPKFEKLLS